MTIAPLTPIRRTSGLGIATPGLAFVAVRDALWRVVATSGVVLGHIERITTPAGDRFAARLALGGGTRAMPLGEFWNAADAADCFV
ncbi:hypothetical protein [Luethyella okanaganae]|uniref:Uncharacterized protein n=1 Tax=Luethyella okanaganae TaxID=69372 RepID=A0ABW1VB88_9MICO